MDGRHRIAETHSDICSTASCSTANCLVEDISLGRNAVDAGAPLRFGETSILVDLPRDCRLLQTVRRISRLRAQANPSVSILCEDLSLHEGVSLSSLKVTSF